MRKIDTRKIQILKIIVEEFVKTGEILGSKSLLKKYDMGVSSATVRNDMASLEQMGLIFQPYNSAGRLPTTRGLRVFVDYLMDQMPQLFIEAQQDFESAELQNSFDDKLYLLASKLTKATGEISFACAPDKATNYYLGMGNFLQKNTPLLGEKVYSVIEVLENKYHFIDLLRELDSSKRVQVLIGEENIIPELDSYAMIVKSGMIDGSQVFVGLLGSLQMDYAYNIAALKNVLA